MVPQTHWLCLRGNEGGLGSTRTIQTTQGDGPHTVLSAGTWVFLHTQPFFPLLLPAPSSRLSLSLVYIIFLHIQLIHSKHSLCTARDSHLFPKHHGWMGNRCSCPLKIYMKTTNSPLTGEINRSLQETVKSSLLGNSVRVMYGPMATGIVIFLSTIKHHQK